MSPALNGSSALQHFKRSNAIEIRNGIMFDFYPGCHIYPPSKPHSIKLGQTFQDNSPHTNLLVTWQLDQHIILCDHVMHDIGEEQLIPG